VDIRLLGVEENFNVVFHKITSRKHVQV
jgi:hypothetical protein